jgi:hypothetical protein
MAFRALHNPITYLDVVCYIANCLCRTFKIVFGRRHENNRNLCHSVQHLKSIKRQLRDSRGTLDFLIFVGGVAAGNLDTGTK